MKIRSRRMSGKYKRVIEMNCFQLISTDPPINQEIAWRIVNLVLVEATDRGTTNVRRGFTSGKSNPRDKEDRTMSREEKRED